VKRRRTIYEVRFIGPVALHRCGAGARVRFTPSGRIRRRRRR